MKKHLKITCVVMGLVVTFGLVKYCFATGYAEQKGLLTSKASSKQINIIKNKMVEATKANINTAVIQDEKYIKTYQTANGETYKIIGTLKISKLNIQYDILSSTSEALLRVSLNHYWGAQPNQVGNMCIVGHNYLDSRFFGKLHTLTTGDVITITDVYGQTLNYYVYDKFIADPYDTRCTSQITNGAKEITLITCYNRGTQRMVVKARANN